MNRFYDTKNFMFGLNKILCACFLNPSAQPVVLLDWTLARVGYHGRQANGEWIGSV